MVLGSHIVNFSSAGRERSPDSAHFGNDRLRCSVAPVHDLLIAAALRTSLHPQGSGAVCAADQPGRFLRHLPDQRLYFGGDPHGGHVRRITPEHSGLLQRVGRGNHVAALCIAARRKCQHRSGPISPEQGPKDRARMNPVESGPPAPDNSDHPSSLGFSRLGYGGTHRESR